MRTRGDYGPLSKENCSVKKKKEKKMVFYPCACTPGKLLASKMRFFIDFCYLFVEIFIGTKFVKF